jgi:hypothetical protein
MAAPLYELIDPQLYDLIVIATFGTKKQKHAIKNIKLTFTKE